MATLRRPVLLQEVSFSMPSSTNTSFPSGCLDGDDCPAAIPAPPRGTPGRGAASPKVRTPGTRRQSSAPALHDEGRSPSPEPCRNYSDADSGSESVPSTRTTHTASASSANRSDRIRSITTRVEYLHRQPVLEEEPARAAEQRRGSGKVFRSERPQSPPSPLARIPRHPNAADPELPLLVRAELNNHESCLRAINESLEELHHLLPKLNDDDNGEVPARTSSQRSRINELCGKLDSLAAAAHDIREAANQRRGTADASQLADIARLLEQITQKADSIGSLLEVLETPPPSRGSERRSVPRSGKEGSAASPHHSTDSASRRHRQRERTSEPNRGSVAAVHRRLLQEKHAETVMDTLEMLTNALCGLAERVDAHHDCLDMVIQAQKKQLVAFEENKLVLRELYELNDRPAESVSSSQAHRPRSRLAENAAANAALAGSFEGGSSYPVAADRASTQNRSVSTTTALNASADRLSSQGAPDRPAVRQMRRDAEVPMGGVTSPAVSQASPGRYRQILTPSLLRARGPETTTELLMHSKGATEPARHRTAEQLSRVTADSLHASAARPVSAEADRLTTPSSGDVSRSLFVEKAEQRTQADVSRSLFFDRASDSSTITRTTEGARSVPRIQHGDPMEQLQRTVGGDKLLTAAERPGSRGNADVFASKDAQVTGSDRHLNLKRMYLTLRSENQSLKQQLETALNQKDQWRRIVEETAASFVV